MLGRKSFCLAVFVMGLALSVVAFSPAHADDLSNRASQFIEGLADKAIAALTEESVSRDERITRFRKLLNEHFAVQTIGQWVLGRYWNRATDKEKEEYLSLFEDLIVITYVDRFTAYSGEKLSVTKSVPANGEDLLVTTVITQPNSTEKVEVSWRVREYKDSFKIVDVIVAGVSMGQTQRSEFASVIRRNGGTVEGLLSKLREDLKKGA